LLDEFSSERSTVVIGTSIDPEMNENDEVKVTVVAAGLGPDMGRVVKPEDEVAVVEEKKVEAPRPAAPSPSPAATEAKQSVAPTDYTKLDRQPAINRKSQEAAAMKKQAESKSDMDYLDIPAFLRRQAD